MKDKESKMVKLNVQNLGNSYVYEYAVEFFHW